MLLILLLLFFKQNLVFSAATTVHPTSTITPNTTVNAQWHRFQENADNIKTDGLTIFANYLDVRLQERIQLTESKHFKFSVRLPQLNIVQEVSLFASALDECDFVDKVTLPHLAINCFLKKEKNPIEGDTFYLEMFTLGLSREKSNASIELIELLNLQAQTHILNLRPVTESGGKVRLVYLIDSQSSEHQDVCYRIEKHQFLEVTVYVTFAATGNATSSSKLLSISKSTNQEFCVAGLFSKLGIAKGAKKYQLTFEIPPLDSARHAESKDAAMYITRRTVPLK